MRWVNSPAKGAVRIIDETLAKRFWPNQDPIGSEIGSEKDGWATIVGVVGDERDTDLAAESKGMIYVPAYAAGTLKLIVRTKSNPTAFVAAIREAAHEVDSSVPVYDVNSIQELVAASLQKTKICDSASFCSFGASVGVYWSLRGLELRGNTSNSGDRNSYCDWRNQGRCSSPRIPIRTHDDPFRHSTGIRNFTPPKACDCKSTVWHSSLRSTHFQPGVGVASDDSAGGHFCAG